MAKQALDGKRLNAFAMDPDELVIIGVDTDDGPEHPQYDPRIELDLVEETVLSILTYGVIETVTVAKDGERAIVVDGRRRVLHAREAKRRQAKAGEVTVSVPVMLRKGDEGTLFGISRAANAHRVQDDALTNADNAARMMGFGKTVEEIAVAFAVTQQTVREWLKLSDCAADVRKAVSNGRIGATAASRLATLPKAEQRAKLETLLAATPAGKRVTVSRATRATRDAKAEPSKPAVTDRRSTRTVRKVREALALAHQRGTIGLGDAFMGGLLLGLGYALGDALSETIPGEVLGLIEAIEAGRPTELDVEATEPAADSEVPKHESDTYEWKE